MFAVAIFGLFFLHSLGSPVSPELFRKVVAPTGHASLGWIATPLSSSLRRVPIHFTVRLKENAAGLRKVHAAALAVSDPHHAQYGQYLSQATIDAMTAPSQHDTQQVQRWIQTAVGCQCNLNRPPTLILFQISCSTTTAAEVFLQTTFHRLYNTQTKQSATRAGNYRVPSAVATVFGLHGLPSPPPVRTRTTAPISPPRNVTPAIILHTYKAQDQVQVAANTTNKQAVVSFGTQVMRTSDLQQFFVNYGSNTTRPGRDDTVHQFVGAPGTSTTGTAEATLDIQYIMGVAQGIPTEFWRFILPVSFCGQFHNFTTTLLAQVSPPLVTSISYGLQSDLSKMGCLPSDFDAVDSDLSKIAARGLTVIVASGDWGGASGGGQFGKCALAINNKISTAFTGDTTGPFPADLGIGECCKYANGLAFTYSGPDPNTQCILHPGNNGSFLTGTVLSAIPIPTLPATVTPAAFCCIEFNILLGKSLKIQGWNFIPTHSPSSSNSVGNCSFLSVVTGNTTSALKGAASGGTTPGGTCTVFTKVTGSTVKVGSTSRLNLQLPLWASWPGASLISNCQVAFFTCVRPN